MKIEISRWTVEKAGNPADENDDAAASVRLDGRIRAAVADGATESSFSDYWAQALVSAWVRGATSAIDQRLLAMARHQWEERLPSWESLPWYAQAKLQEGSHATIAGLDMRIRRARAYWSITVVGDCQLFVLKGDERLWMRRTVPAASASEFGYHPTLISTNEDSWPVVAARAFHGRMRPPFELWMATDAFAECCLSAHQRGERQWNEWARAMRDADSFRAAVNEARTNRGMRNDDTTVVRIRASRE